MMINGVSCIALTVKKQKPRKGTETPHTHTWECPHRASRVKKQKPRKGTECLSLYKRMGNEHELCLFDGRKCQAAEKDRAVSGGPQSGSGHGNTRGNHGGACAGRPHTGICRSHGELAAAGNTCHLDIPYRQILWPPYIHQPRGCISPAKADTVAAVTDIS